MFHASGEQSPVLNKFAFPQLPQVGPETNGQIFFPDLLLTCQSRVDLASELGQRQNRVLLEYLA